MKALALTNENFDSTINGNALPVLVDFWAEWCGPCKVIAPILNDLATEHEGRAVIAKLNVDEAPELAARFGIRSIPTLIIFKSGQPVKTLVGAQPKSALASSLAAVSAS